VAHPAAAFQCTTLPAKPTLDKGRALLYLLGTLKQGLTMASAPKYKVYDRDKEYQAACKEPEAALALCHFYGAGSTIRLGHSSVVWFEGEVTVDSYDEGVKVIEENEAKLQRAHFAKVYDK
jgi:hypothetical protein